MIRSAVSRRLLFLSVFLSLSAMTACDRSSPNAGQARPAPGPESEVSSPGENAESARATTDDAPPDAGPQRPVVAETLPYAEVDEELVYGHFVFPADMVDPLPGVIVIHEWWGLTDAVRSLADRIAAEGYVVLAVDLFGGKSTRFPAEAREMLVSLMQNPARVEENIRQAYLFLVDSGQSPRIGVIGWDFGGGWALNTAMLFPDELDAVVIYYGQVNADEARLAPVNAPILGHFGADDPSIPMDSIRGFERTLEGLGKVHEIEIYRDAKHSFADPASPNFNAEIAETAWARTLAFFARNLSGATD